MEEGKLNRRGMGPEEQILLWRETETSGFLSRRVYSLGSFKPCCRGCHTGEKNALQLLDCIFALFLSFVSRSWRVWGRIPMTLCLYLGRLKLVFRSFISDS